MNTNSTNKPILNTDDYKLVLTLQVQKNGSPIGKDEVVTFSFKALKNTPLSFETFSWVIKALMEKADDEFDAMFYNIPWGEVRK